MSDLSRPRDVTGLTVGELERARRGMQASLALGRLGSPAGVPILACLRAFDVELAERGQQSPAGGVTS